MTHNRTFAQSKAMIMAKMRMKGKSGSAGSSSRATAGSDSPNSGEWGSRFHKASGYKRGKGSRGGY